MCQPPTSQKNVQGEGSGTGIKYITMYIIEMCKGVGCKKINKRCRPCTMHHCLLIPCRSYENFRLFDKQLHRCIFDRRFSQLPELQRYDLNEDSLPVSKHLAHSHQNLEMIFLVFDHISFNIDLILKYQGFLKLILAWND